MPVGPTRFADRITSIPPPEPEIEHDLALVQLGDGGRVAAAERGEHRRVRELAALLGVVERLAEALASRSLSLSSAQHEPLPQPPEPSATARADSA